jgi:hypothetical protein
VWSDDSNGTGFNPEIDDLIRELVELDYWDTAIAGLWLQGRRMELLRLRTSGSRELEGRLRFFAAVLRGELDRVRRASTSGS